jgi:hypothetical protein
MNIVFIKLSDLNVDMEWNVRKMIKESIFAKIKLAGLVNTSLNVLKVFNVQLPLEPGNANLMINKETCMIRK